MWDAFLAQASREEEEVMEGVKIIPSAYDQTFGLSTVYAKNKSCQYDVMVRIHELDPEF